MSKIKQLKDLNLLDRFLFSAVMEDEKSLESILEIILGTDIALKDKAQVAKELRRSPVNKRVYFDVYGEDVEGTVYDAETQKRNTGDLPQRTRYYNGMVDLNLLEPGEDYRDLKDTYVIFTILKKRQEKVQQKVIARGSRYFRRRSSRSRTVKKWGSDL